MKKLFCLLCAALLVLFCALPAFADVAPLDWPTEPSTEEATSAASNTPGLSPLWIVLGVGAVAVCGAILLVVIRNHRK